MMNNLLAKAASNHVVCDRIMAATKSCSRYDAQYVLCLDIKSGRNEKFADTIYNELRKLEWLRDDAVKKVLKLNSSLNGTFLDSEYKLDKVSEQRRMIYDCLDKINQAIYESQQNELAKDSYVS